MGAGEGAGKLQDRTRKLVGPLARRLWTIDVRGLDRLPSEGGAILCPNHVSFLDSAFLIFTLPRRISFVGKAEYLDSWKTKYLFPAMGMIPIDRAGRQGQQGGARGRGEACCERGELFGIFPEGTRSRDGVLYKGHTGPARLAMETGCPIYPVGITGTAEIQPPDAKLPKPFKSCAITHRRADRSRTATSATPKTTSPTADDRRGDVRDPRADRPAVPRHLRHEDAGIEPAAAAHVSHVGEPAMAV